jgi:hypothetical protein
MDNLKLTVMTMKNIKILILALCVLGVKAAIAQSGPSLIIEASQIFPKFRFITPGNTDNNGFTNKIDREFNLGFLYNWKEGLIAGGQLGIYHGGATKVYDRMNYSWDLQYMRVKADIGYVVNRWWVKPYILLSPYYGYMLKASENTGSAVYDLKKNDNLSVHDFGIVFTGGGRVRVTHDLQAFAAYNNNLGCLNIENTPGQKLYNRGFSFSIGLAMYLDDHTTALK